MDHSPSKQIYFTSVSIVLSTSFASCQSVFFQVRSTKHLSSFNMDMTWHDIKPTLFSLIGEAMIVTSPNHNDVQAKGIGPHVTFGVSANQFEDTKKGFCASNHRQMCSYIIPLLTEIFANVMPYAMSLCYVAVLLGQQQRKQATQRSLTCVTSGSNWSPNRHVRCKAHLNALLESVVAIAGRAPIVWPTPQSVGSLGRWCQSEENLMPSVFQV